MAPGAPYHLVEGGLRLAVRLTPRAGRTGILGIAEDAGGEAVVRIAVAAPPVEGKANAALVAFISDILDVPKSAVEIVGGASGRRKVLFVAGEVDELLRRLESVCSN